jgi:ribosomal protein S18 acetylase RimI-like enzyme
LVLIPFSLIDKALFERFDTGNGVVNYAFFNDLPQQLLQGDDYKSYCLVSKSAGVMIGFFSLSQSIEFEISEGYRFLKNFNYVKIDWFGVDKKFQRSGARQGFGRHLMYFALKQIFADYEDVDLVCLEAKRTAMPSYKSYGFIEVPSANVPGGADMFITANNVAEYIVRYETAYLHGGNFLFPA